MSEQLKCEHCGIVNEDVTEDRYDNVLCPECAKEVAYDVVDSDDDADFERDE